MVDSYKMDFVWTPGLLDSWTPTNVILVKVDETYNILKSACNNLFVDRWRWNWVIKVFAGVCPRMSKRLLRPPLLRGRLHLVRDTAVDKEFDIPI